MDSKFLRLILIIFTGIILLLCNNKHYEYFKLFLYKFYTHRVRVYPITQATPIDNQDIINDEIIVSVL